ncbi:hypothetical protein [Roseobacter fucihabitans]|uniref:hypothetical protein n=1 Tax=Roseobacter fucihabitans TaxID=1537242 RepID=UPI001652E201
MKLTIINPLRVAPVDDETIAAKGWGDDTHADVLKRVRHALQRAQKDGHIVQDFGPDGCLWPLSAALQQPLAGMVICGSGPNLTYELCCSAGSLGFPNPGLFDQFAHSGHRLLTPPSPTSDCCAQS